MQGGNLMKEIKLNEDRSVDILNHYGKTYICAPILVLGQIINRYTNLYINVLLNGVTYGFTPCIINLVSNHIDIPSVFTFANDKYRQYSIQKALSMNDNVSKTIVLEFENENEVINWYKKICGEASS